MMILDASTHSIGSDPQVTKTVTATFRDVLPTQEGAIQELMRLQLCEAGINWSYHDIDAFLAKSIHTGLCRRATIFSVSGNLHTLIYFADLASLVDWLTHHPEWTVDPWTHTDGQVYAIYGAGLALVETGLLLAEIHDRYGLRLGLPVAWKASVPDADLAGAIFADFGGRGLRRGWFRTGCLACCGLRRVGADRGAGGGRD